MSKEEFDKKFGGYREIKFGLNRSQNNSRVNQPLIANKADAGVQGLEQQALGNDFISQEDLLVSENDFSSNSALQLESQSAEEGVSSDIGPQLEGFRKQGAIPRRFGPLMSNEQLVSSATSVKSVQRKITSVQSLETIPEVVEAEVQGAGEQSECRMNVTSSDRELNEKSSRDIFVEKVNIGNNREIIIESSVQNRECISGEQDGLNKENLERVNWINSENRNFLTVKLGNFAY